MMMMMFTYIELHNKNKNYPPYVKNGPARKRHKNKIETNNAIDNLI
jgi:hypothetical protein